MFQIVTREDQISTDATNKINQDLIDRGKLYPGLLPYFIAVDSSKYTIAKSGISTIKEPGLPLNQRVRFTISALQSILTYVFNCKVITNNKTSISYIVPYDRRIGAIAIDASKTSFPEAYKIPAKHRFDLDLILDAPTTEEALKHLYSYASQIAVWVSKFNFSNNIVVYDEASKVYQELVINNELGVDEGIHTVVTQQIRNYIHNNWIGLKYDDLLKYINMSPYKDMVSFYHPDPVNKTTGESNVLKL